MIKKISLIILGFILVACTRSKEPQYYLLNPIAMPSKQMNYYKNLHLGIDDITIPAYLEKPQVMISYSPNRVELEEYHQWAGALDKNIKSVISTNLASLLPGAIVESSPWNAKFKPNYQLQIDIEQFTIDMQGNSILRAEFILYHENNIAKKKDVYYRLKINNITIENLIASMNNNLTHLTQDIAQVVRSSQGKP
ncbi:PqiC family protein [Legionella sainthelensi]|uniref:PqiC family protein n=1 Tax=Legionella sainthelensi TaxID=28087 RepID=UPI000E1FD003|nr:PqiC family protein [Legionella sainthelensi]